MPHLSIIAANGSAQRRLLMSTLRVLEGQGYVPGGRIEDGTWNDVFARVRSGGLFGGRLFVVVENAPKLGAFPEELVSLLEGEDAESAVVALCEGDVRRFFPKEVLARVDVVRAEEPPRWGAARRKWIDRMAAEESVRLDGEANALLGEWFEDAEELRSEIAKLGAAATGGMVSAQMVRVLSVDEGRNALLDLLDGICRGARTSVLRSLESLRLHAPLLPTVAALYNRLRIALHLGMFSGEELEKVLAAGGVRDYQRRLAQEAAQRYPALAVKDAVAELAVLSCAEKRGLGGGWCALEVCLLALLSSGSERRNSNRGENVVLMRRGAAPE